MSGFKENWFVEFLCQCSTIFIMIDHHLNPSDTHLLFFMTALDLNCFNTSCLFISYIYMGSNILRVCVQETCGKLYQIPE